MSLKRLGQGLLVGCAATLAGCAALSSGDANETVTITSLPSANVKVVNVTGLSGYVDINHHGDPVYTGRTPVTLELPAVSSDRSALQAYVIAVQKPGYETHETRLEAIGAVAKVPPEQARVPAVATHWGWQLEDPRTHEVTSMPYNQVDVELKYLNE